MEERFSELAGSALLALLDSVLDALADPRHRIADDAESLALLAGSLRVAARLSAWQVQLAAHLDADEAAWRAHGTSLTTWLADTANLTPREASALLAQGREQVRFKVVGEAAADGAVLPSQAVAITAVLDQLPDDLPTAVVTEAEQTMVGFAATYNSTELRRLARHLLEVIDPATAEAREAARLERDHRLATRSRHLTFTHDHHGSILIKGSLPLIAAEPLVRIVEAYAAAQKRALDAADPQAEYVTPAMRRADGLVAMVHHHAQQSLAPTHGGDRPRISITLSYQTLLDAAHAAAAGDSDSDGDGDGLPTSHLTRPLSGHLTGTGDPIPASELRQLLCDADLLPTVLGGRSEILDVGRTQRLVTAPIRTALELRDGGCIFPGCDKPPADCHAHHLIPWWAGGPTSLENLVLACPHHHGIIEPSHDPTADRWKARIADDGTPEVIPPLRVDPRQRPRRHTRLTLPAATRPASVTPSPAPQDHAAVEPAH